MANIDVVIKIDEETYRDIQSHDWKNGEWWYSEEWRAIHNGIPLPKGHGDLIDVNEIIGKIHGVKSITAVLDAQPIIKADKENK